MPMSLDRDAGFCSGSSELGDDYQPDRVHSTSPCSPADSSDDSIEIKLMPISIPKKKHKLHETSMSMSCNNESDVPLKKRIKFDTTFAQYEWHPTERKENVPNKLNKNSSTVATVPASSVAADDDDDDETILDRENAVPINLKMAPINLGEMLPRHPGVTTLHRVPECSNEHMQPSSTTNEQYYRNACIIDEELHETSKSKTARKSSTNFPSIDKPDASSSSISSDAMTASRSQRNYKNMTRERRIEANARERTRVHTISAAFDTLRSAIPSYSNSQKLSKLSVLRVACSYIMTLSRMTGDDYSLDQSAPSVAECLEEVTKTIQTEGKVRKRKDETD